ncbi:MAG: NADH:flavin oxidoreductase [Burkholderiaceae bacterium]
MNVSSPLFELYQFGGRRLKSRVVMAPMTRNKSPGGVPGPDVAEYYRSRAEGGVGLIISEGTYIDHPAANGYVRVPAFHGKAALEGWQRVLDGVHAAGTAMIPQLWHVGSVRRPGMEPDPSVPGCGPVSVIEDGREVVVGMTHADIREVVASFARAASDARRLGFDGVEIHGAHGYLIDQFFWAETNRRQDEYGGPAIENRVRFAEEIVKAVRAAVGPGFPIVFRFSQWKSGRYDARIFESVRDLQALLDPLVAAGVDLFHVSTRRFWEPAFDGMPDTLAALTRKLSGRPVIGVGSVGLDKPHESRVAGSRSTFQAAATDVDRVLAALQAREFDLVAVGRALLAEPMWVDKVRAGRFQEIRGLDQEAYRTLVV